MSGGAHIVDVDATLVGDFVAYARTYGAEHDDSYVTADDLASFDPASEPAAVILDDSGTVVGAASAMVSGYITEGASRFRILHAQDPVAYADLIGHITARLPEGVERLFLFLPEHAGPVEAALEIAGFAVTRRAYILRHADPHNISMAAFPDGACVEAALPVDEQDWAHVINAAFHGQPGHYEMTPERAGEILGRPGVVREASLFVRRGGAPAGLVLTVLDEDDPYSAEIETLAVTPIEQGNGLGRALLLSAVAGAARFGCRTVSLSVSTENRRALALYLDSGFRADDVRVCWQASISRPADA